MQEKYKPEGFLLNTPENRELTGSLSGIEYAYAGDVTLEGWVTKCDNAQNLTVELGAFSGVIPREETLMTYGGTPIRDIAVITRVGKPVCVKITRIERGENGVQLRLSRKAAQEECFREYIRRLRAGDVLEAKVTHTEPFGAFCDVGCGIVSLLSIDCISVSRILHPRDRFRVGDVIRALVKSPVDDCGRITLTHKELLGTWEQNASRFSPGETAAGIVRSVEPYGIFVELAPNLAGLAEWRDEVRVGQCAAVYIKSILPEKMKIKLVIVDVQNCDRPQHLPEYFFTGDHMDSWRYSPPSSERVIETVFA